MEVSYLEEVELFKTAKQWQRLYKGASQTHGRTLDPAMQNLLPVIEGYADDLRSCLGISEPYLDDLMRLDNLKSFQRMLGPVYDLLCDRYRNKEVPAMAQSLLNFLNNTSMYFAKVIYTIEQDHSELTNFFQLERETYASSLNASSSKIAAQVS